MQAQTLADLKLRPYGGTKVPGLIYYHNPRCKAKTSNNFKHSSFGNRPATTRNKTNIRTTFRLIMVKLAFFHEPVQVKAKSVNNCSQAVCSSCHPTQCQTIKTLQDIT